MVNNVRVEEMYSGMKKNQTANRFALGPVSLQFVTIMLLALFSLVYLMQNNQMTTQGYKVAQLKTEQLDILQENEKYQVEAARLKALSEIKNQIKDMEMEKVNSVKYLAVQK